jgi:hypothetical protein
MISAASGVAETSILPVEVLTKSAPWLIAKWVARSIAARSGRAPLSMMTLSSPSP